MRTLSDIKSGWKWLETVLNNIIKGINQRTIIAGPGIDVNESPSGVMIMAGAGRTTSNESGLRDDKVKPPGVTHDATWMIVTIMDKDCNKRQCEVWARPLDSGTPGPPL